MFNRVIVCYLQSNYKFNYSTGKSFCYHCKPWSRFHHKHGLMQNWRIPNWQMPSIVFQVQDTLSGVSMIWQMKIRNCCLCDLSLNWMMQKTRDHHFKMYGSCYASRQKNCMDPFQKHNKNCTSKYAKAIIIRWSVIRFILDWQTRHGVMQGWI